jgi:thioesterase domain-containing protein
LLVEPAEPERVLRSLDGVRRAAVLPQSRGDAPARLVAHLVLAEGSSLTPAAVDAGLRAELPPHLVPGIVMVHDELPLTSRGKLDRAALAALPPTPWRTDAAPRPHSDAEWFALGAAGQVLDIDGLGLDDDLWEHGLDSLAAVQLCSMIADAGHGEVEPTRLLVHRSPRAVAAMLGRRVPVRASDAVVLNPEGTSPPLFFVPGAGMTALSAVALAAALGADQPVIVVEATGLHRRGKVDRTVSAAARSALVEIDRHQPDGPVVVAGFSAGGPVAYEIGQLLGSRGRSVHVCRFDAGLLSGTGGGGRRRARTAARSVPAMARWAVRESVIAWRMVVPGSPSARASRYAAFRRLGRRASRRYDARPASFPVTVFEVEGSTAGARTSPFVERLEVVRVGGDHRSHIESPHVTVVADHLRQVLGGASGFGGSETVDGTLGPRVRSPPN